MKRSLEDIVSPMSSIPFTPGTFKLFCRGWGETGGPDFHPCRGLWTFIAYDETYCQFEQYQSPEHTWAIPLSMLDYFKFVATTTDTPGLRPE